MELRDIEYFSVIAKHGHLGRAAEELGLSQPALSMSLRRLEESMQAKLVQRTPKGLALTAVGSAMLSRVQQLRLSMDDVVPEAADLSAGRAGDVRVGATPEFAEYLLPASLRQLFESAPKVTVTVTVAAPDLLRPALSAGELDIIVSGIAGAPHADLVHIPLLEDLFVVISATTHRLARQARVSAEDLARERWTVSAASVMSWKWLHQLFKQHGLAPPCLAMKSNSAWLRLLTIASSDVLGFTSKRFLQQVAGHLPLAVLNVEEPTFARPIGIMYRKDAYVSPAVMRLAETLKATGERLSAENA